MDRQLPRRMALVLVAAGAGMGLNSAHGGIQEITSNSNQSGIGGPRSESSENQVEDEPVAVETSKNLWRPWLALWNGDLAIANQLIAPSFVAHFAPVGSSPGEVHGPEGLTGWISGILAAFTGHRFEMTVGPLAEGTLVAGRWVFRATYQGGIPGSATDAVGTAVEYAGIDILRVEDEQIVEYWLCADTLDLLQQIGVIPS
jgi:predicted ester cyclase